jgi:beta-lactamase regulating signal transducer with metallopeptidase domain
MLTLLADAALRSTLLAVAAWLGLALLRLRHPQRRMAVWTAVLLVSTAMPALTPLMRVTIPNNRIPARWLPVASAQASWRALRRIAPPHLAPAPIAVAAAAASTPDVPAPAPVAAADWRAVATAIYLAVAGALMLRLLIGLLLMAQIVRAARPVEEEWAAGTDVRVSDVMVVPVTFASTILLPQASVAWSARKRSGVLLHEQSHVAQGDFYLLLLAAIYRAAFWFNPFAWWLAARLADLAETIGDEAAVAGLADRRGYADILLEVASDERRVPSGVAMARPGTVRRRVARILRATTAMERMGRHRRLLTTAALLPLAALSAGTVARGAAVPAVAADTDAAGGLDRYVGAYQLDVTMTLAVTRDGDQLFAQKTEQPKLRLIALGGPTFVTETGDATLTFITRGGGPAANVVLRSRLGAERRGWRIAAAWADAIDAHAAQRAAAAPERFSDQTPMPGSRDALVRTIEALRLGHPEDAPATPQLAAQLRRKLPLFEAALGALGGIESIAFAGVGPGGNDVYDVTFAKGWSEFRIDLSSGDVIGQLNFRPGGDGTPGGVASCSQETTLRPQPGAVPITLSIANRSGAEIGLYWLDAAGRRIFPGAAARRMQNGRTTDMLTEIGRPVVVTDAEGQCREIVLPGESTRIHRVEAAETAPSAAPRTGPVAGSDEALLRHIEGLRRGAPDYEQMTAALAADTQRLLPRRQALLAALGAVRELSFRGVTPGGADIYLVRFANGAAEWQITLAGEGRIASVALGPPS